MITTTTDADNFMNIRCEGADGCGAKFDGVGPLWGADILATHQHGPANGNDGQRAKALQGRFEFNRRQRDAADKARRAAAAAEFWAGRNR